MQLKLDKKTRNLRICLLDLDLQTSHVCDYLDIDARLQLQEIVEQPERLDAQLFDLFVSSHSSGLTVLAAPRNRKAPLDLECQGAGSSVWNDCDPIRFADHRSAAALVPVDRTDPFRFRPCRGNWLEYGSRAEASRRDASRPCEQMERVPPQIVVALNRCRSRLLGRVANKQHAQRMLGQETILYVREDVQQLLSRR